MYAYERWRRNAKVGTAFGGKWDGRVEIDLYRIGNKFSKLERTKAVRRDDARCPILSIRPGFSKTSLAPPFNEVQTSPQPYSPDMYSARVRRVTREAAWLCPAECNQNSHVRISNLAANTPTVEPTTRGILIPSPSLDWQKPNRESRY